MQEIVKVAPLLLQDQWKKKKQQVSAKFRSHRFTAKKGIDGFHCDVIKL